MPARFLSGHCSRGRQWGLLLVLASSESGFGDSFLRVSALSSGVGKWGRGSTGCTLGWALSPGSGLAGLPGRGSWGRGLMLFPGACSQLWLWRHGISGSCSSVPALLACIPCSCVAYCRSSLHLWQGAGRGSRGVLPDAAHHGIGCRGVGDASPVGAACHGAVCTTLCSTAGRGALK